MPRCEKCYQDKIYYSQPAAFLSCFWSIALHYQILFILQESRNLFILEFGNINLWYLICLKEKNDLWYNGTIRKPECQRFWVNMTPLLSSIKNKWLLGIIIIQNIVTIGEDLLMLTLKSFVFLFSLECRHICINVNNSPKWLCTLTTFYFSLPFCTLLMEFNRVQWKHYIKPVN